ncbi:undecaprenyl-diphosphate phosphatase [Candidatus Parcubacteria bacterium]|nr:MAG: undecaprenyl-diphosphate phosphatase [Candidatus Parcubacteria bacterium]
MSFFDAIILGVVEGITEFLPISSTGHLILAVRLLDIPQTEFVKSFEIAIQLGAILAVLILYGKTLVLDREAVKRVLAAFVPTGAIGLLLYAFAKDRLLGNETVVLAALFLGGIFLILFERFHREREDAVEGVSEVSYAQALLIGVAQAVAIVPGISRAAATILGGLALGLKRRTIVEFSFLLAVPTMLAATALDLAKVGASFSPGEFGVLFVGFLVSCLVAVGTIRFLLGFIQKHTFVSFGAYRVILAVLFFVAVL